MKFIRLIGLAVLFFGIGWFANHVSSKRSISVHRSHYSNGAVFIVEWGYLRNGEFINDGPYIVYYETGVINSFGLFSHDVMNGMQYEWGEDGQLVRSVLYINGQPLGGLKGERLD